MKILLVTDGIMPFILGGMQRHSTYLAKYLTLQGCEVTLVHCVDNSSSLPTEDQINDFLFNGDNKLHKIIGLKFPKAKWFPGHYIYNSYLYSKMIYDKIRSEIYEYDFIYAKGFTVWKLISKKKKGLKAPKIGIKFHGYEMYQTSNGIKMKLQHWLLRYFVKWNTINSDVVFSYGSKITDIILKLGVQSSFILEIPSGIDSLWLRENKLEHNSTIRFVFLGRYERRKGIEELSLAIKELIKKKINAEFHFIGPIPEKKKIISASSYLTYHGRIMDFKKIKEIMDSSDVLICPSHSEGMPNVILEAMSRGLAIIATDVGAVSQMVGNDNGILISAPKKSFIKNAINHFLEMKKDHLIEKRENSIKKIKRCFLWEKIIKKTKEDIVKIINEES